jgi:hypothetical protein
MKLRFTMNDENSGSAFICFQQLSHLFSEQAFDSKQCVLVTHEKDLGHSDFQADKILAGQE